MYDGVYIVYTVVVIVVWCMLSSIHYVYIYGAVNIIGGRRLLRQLFARLLLS